MTIDPIDPNTTDTKQLRAALDTIVQTDPEDYSRISRDGHSLDLSTCVPIVARLVSVFGKVRDSDINVVPEAVRQGLASAIRDTQDEFRRIRDLDPQRQSRDQVASDLDGVYARAYENLAPILAHVGTDPAGFDELRRQADARLADITAAEDRIKGMEGQAAEALVQIKGAAAEAGVSQHAIIFGEVADRHSKASRWWLGISAALASVTLFLAWQMTNQIADRTVPGAIQFVAARLILFGVLSYALVSSIRTYRAESHNRVVNAHRHHALSTFETFTAASSDEATKNAVLMQATQCIFSHRPSGFGQRDEDATAQAQVMGLTSQVLSKTKDGD